MYPSYTYNESKNLNNFIFIINIDYDFKKMQKPIYKSSLDHKVRKMIQLFKSSINMFKHVFIFLLKLT